jgi:hypothetical protein
MTFLSPVLFGCGWFTFVGTFTFTLLWFACVEL